MWWACNSVPVALRISYVLLAASLPWSFNMGASAQALVPAELVIGVIAICLLRHFKEMMHFRTNPAVMVSGLALLWGWVAALCAENPIVGLKYMVVSSAMWWVFFLPSLRWPDLFDLIIPVFGLSMGIAACRVVFIFGYFYQFRSDQANLAPMPFFDDHNLFAAIIATLVFFIGAKPFRFPAWRQVRPVMFIVLGLSLVVSTSRGGLLSAMGAVMVAFLFLSLNNKTAVYGLLLAGTMVVTIGWLRQDQIIKFIKEDVSMAERLNRYNCALRMFNDRPLTGFGPGNFETSYIRYQQPEWRTRISLDAPLTQKTPEHYGHGGGVHSEYLQVLCENGWPGLAILCLFWGIILCNGFTGTKFDQVQKQKILLLAGLLALGLHGWLNNFFHDPRISMLVWVGAGQLATK